MGGPRILVGCARWLLAAAIALPVLAQDAGALAGFGLRDSTAELPGLGRMAVVLALMIALAAAATLVLRRYWPPAARRADGAIRVTAQLSLSNSMKLHFVEAGGLTVLIAEGRGGIAITQLGRAESSTTPTGEANDAR
jgi:hypothetical protein